MLRFVKIVEAGRGHYRNAGSDPAAMEGRADGTGEVLLPRMREDHAAASTLPCDASRFRRAQPARYDSVREVRPTSAAEPAKRAIWPGRHRSQRLDAGRPGRCLHFGSPTPAHVDRGPRSGG